MTGSGNDDAPPSGGSNPNTNKKASTPAQLKAPPPTFPNPDGKFPGTGRTWSASSKTVKSPDSLPLSAKSSASSAVPTVGAKRNAPVDTTQNAKVAKKR